MAFEPNGFQTVEFRWVGWQLAGPPSLGDLIRKGLLEFLLRSCCLKLAVFFPKGISEVAVDYSRVVVANQRVDLPSRGGRLLLQAHEKVVSLPCLRSPRRNVAYLHQVSGPADPILLSIDQSRHSENGGERIFVAVDISHCHDAPDTLPVVLRCISVRG
jgi:hypothetical protein